MTLLEQINAEIEQLNAEIASLQDNTEARVDKVKRGRGRPPVVEDKEFITIWNVFNKRFFIFNRTFE